MNRLFKTLFGGAWRETEPGDRLVPKEKSKEELVASLSAQTPVAGSGALPYTPNTIPNKGEMVLLKGKGIGADIMEALLSSNKSTRLGGLPTVPLSITI